LKLCFSDNNILTVHVSSFTNKELILIQKTKLELLVILALLLVLSDQNNYDQCNLNQLQYADKNNTHILINFQIKLQLVNIS